jgi:hypothetical protein
MGGSPSNLIFILTGYYTAKYFLCNPDPYHNQNVVNQIIKNAPRHIEKVQTNGDVDSNNIALNKGQAAIIEVNAMGVVDPYHNPLARQGY